jgi:hypothetical protein
VELLVRVGVRLLVGHARMASLVARFGQLMFNEDDVLREHPAISQPDPALCHDRIWVVSGGSMTDEPAVVIIGSQQVLLVEHVVLNLADLVLPEADRTVAADYVGQVTGDVSHVAVRSSEQLVRLCGPTVLCLAVERVPGPDASAAVEIAVIVPRPLGPLARHAVSPRPVRGAVVPGLDGVGQSWIGQCWTPPPVGQVLSALQRRTIPRITARVA